MIAVIFQTRDGLRAQEDVDDSLHGFPVIRRRLLPRAPVCYTLKEQVLADDAGVAIRSYEFRGERHEGCPVYEEVP